MKNSSIPTGVFTARVRTVCGVLFAMAALVLASTQAVASEPGVRVVLTEVAQGGTDLVTAELSKIEGIDLRDYAWFGNQVRGRGFIVNGIVERPSDLRWVMGGSNIDWIVDIVLSGDGASYEARFISRETAAPTRTVVLDRGDRGLTPAGAQLVRFEFEKVLGIGQPAADSASGNAPQVESLEPEEVRQRAAAERAAIAERLQRDWMWIRAHGRLLRKDFFVTGQNALFSYASGAFPGLDLEVEAFPFVLSNPEMASAGVYVNYVHGFDSLTLIVTGDSGTEAVPVSLGQLNLEGGLIYRLDSPLDETINQLRFRLGLRYEAFMASENPLIPSTGLVAIALGTRLLVPLFVDGFAVAANLDIMPLAFFGKGRELFGSSSFSYGFGTELGMHYAVMPELSLSFAYGFRLIRTDFSGPGAGDFADSDAFDLFQGLKAGIVYRY
jgi:hypothetical protein